MAQYVVSTRLLMGIPLKTRYRCKMSHIVLHAVSISPFRHLQSLLDRPKWSYFAINSVVLSFCFLQSETEANVRCILNVWIYRCVLYINQSSYTRVCQKNIEAWKCSTFYNKL